MFRIPYRWLPRTALTNLRSMWEDSTHGVRNVFRWLPIIWFDADFDSYYLNVIMQYKFRRMSKAISQGHRADRDRQARQLLICAELCRRLSSEFEVYYKNAEKRFPNKGRDWAEMVSGLAKADQKLLGKMIGKHLQSWWD